VRHEHNILLEDNPRSFADAVVMFLQDRELRSRYERAAAELAAQYDWPAIGVKFSQVLGGVAGVNASAAKPCVQV
jgi:glycosyltransferase involved in cell wall biosynthesis